MPLTPQEVASKVFGPTRIRRGYDENEVDAFLDIVEAELTRLTAENDRLRRELKASGREVPDADEVTPATASTPAGEVPSAVVPSALVSSAVVPSSLGATVPTSPLPTSPPPNAPPTAREDTAVEKQVARMLVLAQQTADAAVREAMAEAEATRASARVEAERLLSDARARSTVELGDLRRSKRSLEVELEQLQAFERDYRQRLRAYLTMQLNELADAGVEPAAVKGGGAPSHDAIESEGSIASESEVLDPGPLTIAPSEPPAFGPVWSPSSDAGDGPVIGGPRKPAGRSGSSPSDTGGQGHRISGFGSAP